MVIEIILADEKRRLVEIEKEKQRKREEEFTEKLIHKWTESILYSLKEKIENKDNFYCFRQSLSYADYFVPDFFKSQREATNNILNECLKIVKEVLEAGGYSVSIDKYAKGYQTRSNQFGYIVVSW